MVLLDFRTEILEAMKRKKTDEVESKPDDYDRMVRELHFESRGTVRTQLHCCT